MIPPLLHRFSCPVCKRENDVVDSNYGGMKDYTPSSPSILYLTQCDLCKTKLTLNLGYIVTTLEVYETGKQ